MVGGSLNQGLDVLQLGEVTGHRQDLNPGGGADLTSNPLQFPCVPAANHQVGAFLRQRIGTGAAQSLAAAADDRNPILKSQVHVRLQPESANMLPIRPSGGNHLGFTYELPGRWNSLDTG